MSLCEDTGGRLERPRTLWRSHLGVYTQSKERRCSQNQAVVSVFLISFYRAFGNMRHVFSILQEIDKV